MTPHSTPQDELWVKAPEMQGWVYKRGFAWRKTWTRRWLILQNREIAYYEKRPLQRDLQAVEPRGVATLQRDLQVFDSAAGSGGGGGGGGGASSSSASSGSSSNSGGGSNSGGRWRLAASSSRSSHRDLEITLLPGGGAPAWELRCESADDKQAWLRVFRRCEHIAGWLVRFQMGGLLGVGAAAVVREVRVRATDERKTVPLSSPHHP